MDVTKILEGNTLREEVDYLGSYYELPGAPLYDDEGNVYAGLILLVNITHQKLLTRDINEKMKEYEALYEEYLSQAETLKKNYDHLQQINEELTYSEKKYRTFIEQTNDGVYHFSFRKPLDIRKPAEQQLQTIFYDTWLSDCNDAFVQMYGARDKKELIGKNLLYFYGGDEKGNREVNLRFIKSGYKLLRDETIEFDAEGNKVYFLNNTLGLIENNILTTIWGTQSDITKKKAYEEALVTEKEKAQRNEKKYIDLFNNLNDGVLLYEIGKDRLPGKIYEANDEICNLLQTDKNALLGSFGTGFYCRGRIRESKTAC
ncbi:MAG: PAS domain-containing protein [Bacteroidales bacterium]|nr:PAS domain-containing protein [Bacteroidales bacterium]